MGNGWTCDNCGNTGTIPEGQIAEDVLCPHCGEPVTGDPKR